MKPSRYIKCKTHLTDCLPTGYWKRRRRREEGFTREIRGRAQTDRNDGRGLYYSLIVSFRCNPQYFSMIWLALFQ